MSLKWLKMQKLMEETVIQVSKENMVELAAFYNGRVVFADREPSEVCLRNTWVKPGQWINNGGFLVYAPGQNSWELVE